MCSGFMVTTFMQIQWTALDTLPPDPLGLITAFVSLTLVTIGGQLCCCVLCALMLAAALQASRDLVARKQRSEFFRSAHAFATRANGAAPPRCQGMTFSLFWVDKCQAWYLTAFVLFASGPALAQASLLLSVWLKFDFSHAVAWAMTAVLLLTLLMWAYLTAAWAPLLVHAWDEAQRRSARPGAAAQRPAGLPWDWHLLPPLKQRSRATAQRRCNPLQRWGAALRVLMHRSGADASDRSSLGDSTQLRRGSKGTSAGGGAASLVAHSAHAARRQQGSVGAESSQPHARANGDGGEDGVAEEQARPQQLPRAESLASESSSRGSAYYDAAASVRIPAAGASWRGDGDSSCEGEANDEGGGSAAAAVATLRAGEAAAGRQRGEGLLAEWDAASGEVWAGTRGPFRIERAAALGVGAAGGIGCEEGAGTATGWGGQSEAEVGEANWECQAQGGQFRGWEPGLGAAEGGSEAGGERGAVFAGGSDGGRQRGGEGGSRERRGSDEEAPGADRRRGQKGENGRAQLGGVSSGQEKQRRGGEEAEGGSDALVVGSEASEEESGPEGEAVESKAAEENGEEGGGGEGGGGERAARDRAWQREQRSWAEQDAAARQLEEARWVWEQYALANRRDVAEKTEHLQAFAGLCSVVGGFSMSAFMELNW